MKSLRLTFAPPLPILLLYPNFYFFLSSREVGRSSASLLALLLCLQAPLDGRRVPKQYDGDTDNTSAFSSNNTRFNNKHNNYIKYTKSEEKENT
jgi:hypothetical protein